jgi:putative cell wall binding repeat protein
VRPKRPINADVPAPAEETKEQPAPAEPKPKPTPAPAEPKPTPRRPPKPLAPKLLAGLVVLALIFIVVAILGSSGGPEKSGETGAPAPAPAPPAKEPGGESVPSQTAEALGYPSFATNNTTRVGGSSPSETAAAVALAVFPSTAPSQQPAAVSLVSEEDWAGAIAASVLMAPPVRAPVLFGAADEVPEATAEALGALDPQGSKATEGAAFFAVGAVALPDGAGKTTRIDSGDPASTAAQIATLRDRLFGGEPAAYLVAPAGNPDVAMPAAAWAARSGDPVLFAEAEKLPQPTAAVLERHPKVPVYVLGPSSAISAQVVGEIGKVAKRVKRVAGRDAISTALAFARYRDGNFGWDVNDPGHGFVLARSDSPSIAAAAAPLSASGTWGPLLLTDNAATLPAEVRSYFLDVKPGYTTNPTRAFYNHVWVIGDQEAIDVNQQAEVNALAELTKIGGGE